jgi:dihydroorotate dehydrogenase
MYKRIVKPLMFLLSPERAHYVAMGMLVALIKIPGAAFFFNRRTKSRNTSLVVAGISFPNCVGLAAGFDKDARWVDELACLGFGHIEVGTLTPKAQPGNDKPRLFRLPKDEGLINRMGFNNGGVDAAANRLRARKSHVVVGGNIGKNKLTPNEEALSDYLYCLNALHDCVDYFVVNVSSPNTPGLRDLQEKEPLKKILMALQEKNLAFSIPRPIFLKIAPDLTHSQLDDIIEIVVESKIAGVIATNTTVSRDDLKTSKNEVERIGAGGLSGKPVFEKSNEVIHYIMEKSNHAFPVIGVGGIHSVKDAQRKKDLGCDLIQLYSGFIYEGPGLVSQIANGE